jgi:hypothetical protein
VLTAGLSGSATVAVLSDSETVNVQISPDNVTATVVDNASAPAEENVTSLNTTAVNSERSELPTVEEAGGLVVFLDPADGQTVEANGTAEYDVYVMGATEGVAGYDLRLKLSDPSVASFEGFEHHANDSGTGEAEINGDHIYVSAGLNPAIPNMSADDKISLGTVTVAGEESGTSRLEPVNDSSYKFVVSKLTSDSDSVFNDYDIGEVYGSDLTVTSANEPPTATSDTYSVSKVDTLQHPASVLENDDDPDGDELTTSLVSGPSNGELEFATNGSFVYTPASNFTGQAEFTYKAHDDNGGVDSATVTIQVETPGNGSKGNGPPGE